jgi:hypothetical protein
MTRPQVADWGDGLQIWMMNKVQKPIISPVKACHKILKYYRHIATYPLFCQNSELNASPTDTFIEFDWGNRCLNSSVKLWLCNRFKLARRSCRCLKNYMNLEILVTLTTRASDMSSCALRECYALQNVTSCCTLMHQYSRKRSQYLNQARK